LNTINTTFVIDKPTCQLFSSMFRLLLITFRLMWWVFVFGTTAPSGPGLPHLRGF